MSAPLCFEISSALERLMDEHRYYERRPHAPDAAADLESAFSRFADLIARQIKANEAQS
jgi:hypothetical protein